MISEILLFRLLLSFCSGCIIVAAVTAVADRWGTRRAGFLGGLPSTGAASLLFIGWSQTTAAAIQATAVFPLGFSITFVYLLVYARSPNRGFRSRMAIALSVWFLLSAVVVASGLTDFVLTLAGSIVVCTVAYLLHKRTGIRDLRPEPRRYAWREVLARASWRGAIGGSVVVGVVILSIIGGPAMGGVFAAFPAIWTSSLYVTNRDHGLQFSRALTRSFMATGILTIIPYSVAVRYLFPVVGVWWGTLFAYVAISPAAWLAWKRTLF